MTDFNKIISIFQRLILITLCVLTCSLNANASVLQLDEAKSKVTYTLTQFGFPFKRKPLPTIGEIELNENMTMLKAIKMKTRFTSKNPLFKKFINSDKYPNFEFVTVLDKPIQINGAKDIELTGDVLFHGEIKRVSIKLKNKSTEKKIVLTGNLNIEMSNFGLTPPHFAFFYMDDLIRNKVELVANL